MVRVLGIAAAVIAALALVVLAFLLLNRDGGDAPEPEAGIHFTAAGILPQLRKPRPS
jgi:ABC-type transporter Mla subunit MlaD